MPDRTSSDPTWTRNPPDAVVALAVERRLGASVLAQLGADHDVIERWKRAGRVLDAGESRPLSVARFGTQEPALTLLPGTRQPVLRAAARQGRLAPLTLRLEELLGIHSQAALIRKLQSGTLIFRRETAHRVPVDTQRELLASLGDPIDPDWLEGTYGARLSATVAVALNWACSAALCTKELYGWAIHHPWEAPASELTSALICHALLREDFDTAARLLADHEGADAPSLRACLQLMHPDVSSAPRCPPSLGEACHLEPLLIAATVRRPACDAVARDRLRKLSAKNRPGGWKAASKLLQLLRGERAPSAADLRRLDPHRLPSEASAWEVLLLGLWMLGQPGPGARRSAWAHVLTRRSLAWLEAGYRWFSRQGLLLSQAFDEGTMRQVIEAHDQAMAPDAVARLERTHPADLIRLVPARAPWERTLDQLEQLDVQELAPPHLTRLNFAVDVAAKRLGRPGREARRLGEGWELVERLSWEEALELHDELPPEDRRVLRAWESERAESDEGPIFDALVDHPRVSDPSQGGLDVEIRRRRWTLVAQWTKDELLVDWEPARLDPGWSVLGVDRTKLEVVFVSEDEALVARTVAAPLRIPGQGAERALDVLAKLSDHVTVRGPALASRRRVEADTTPWLRWSQRSGAWLLECGVKPFGAEGRFFPAGDGPTVLSTNRGGRPACTVRSLELEQERCRALVHSSQLLAETEPDAEGPHRWFLSTDRALEVLAELKSSPVPVRMEWSGEEALKLGSPLSAGALRGALRANRGWYLLSGHIPLDEVNHVRLADLTKAPLLARGRFVGLPDGSYAEIDRRLRRLIATVGVARERKGQVRLTAAQLPGLAEALDGTALDLDESSRASLQSWKPAPPPSEPPLDELLRPYQRLGRDWLTQLGGWGLGACLADDMGLGKTVQILASLLSREPAARHLVIAPTSVCDNWCREAARFAPSLRARLFDPKSDVLEPGLVVLSYGQVVQHLAQLEEIPFDCVVADEAQMIKNPKTQRARAVLSLQSQWRIAATGTPIENHLGDLWGIFRFLNPGLLGSWRAFQTHYVGPIERDHETFPREQLGSLIRPFVLRRTKAEVLAELPPVTRLRQSVVLSEDEALRYAGLRRSISDKLRTRAGKMNNKLEVLAEITRLRRFCCHPRLVFPEAPDDSAKLRALVPLVRELVDGGRRALVFSQYVDFLDSVRQRLSEQGIEHEYLDGSTPRATRQKRVDGFMRGSCPVFLLSLKAGGLGLNLTAADVVIHLDPWWNPAVLDQATDRAHRIGQTRPVTSIEFVAEGTIEEDIFRLHDSKRDLVSGVLDTPNQTAGAKDEELLAWLEKSLVAQAQGRLDTSASMQDKSSSRPNGF